MREDRCMRRSLLLLRGLENRYQPCVFALYKVGEGPWSATVRFHDFGAETRQPLLYGFLAQAFVQGFRKLVDDWLRRALWREHRIEGSAVAFRQALFIGSWHIRQH